MTPQAETADGSADEVAPAAGDAPGRPRWARRLGHPVGWLVLLAVVVAVVAAGAVADDGPQTPDERVRALSERVACPSCEGESVAESRAPSSENIRNVIRRLVDEGAATDAQILTYLEDTQGGRILLVPRGSGFDALAWALPAAAFVVAVAGLGAAFVRWRREAAAVGGPSEEDRRLVADALAEEDPSVTDDPDGP